MSPVDDADRIEGQRNIVPVPDPTVLTNQLVAQKVDALREVIETRLDGMDRAIALQSIGLNKVPSDLSVAIENVKALLNEKVIALANQLSAHATQSSKAIDAAFAAAKDAITEANKLHEEKFRAFDIRLKERDDQTEKAARDVKSAVDAAFAAAKEAVGEQNKSNALSITKSETATAKQMDQQGERIGTLEKSMNDKIEALKQTTDDKVNNVREEVNKVDRRLNGIGGRGEGQSEQHLLQVQANAARNSNIALFVMAAVAVVALITLAFHIAGH